MAGRVVALGDEDVVIYTRLQRLVEWNWWTHELLFDPAEPIETRLELKVMITVCFRNGGDNGNVVALGTNIVCGGHHSNVNVYQDVSEESLR